MAKSNESKELLKMFGACVDISDFDNKGFDDMEKYQKDCETFEGFKKSVSSAKKAVEGISSLTKDEIVSLIIEGMEA